MLESPLLVSFCNQLDAPGNILALVHGDNVRWVDFGPNAPPSANGIAVTQEAIFCACSNENISYIAIFDRDLELRDYVLIRDVLDIHSICVDGTAIIAVSTGTDELVRLEVANLAGECEVLWRAGAQREDAHHLNGVTIAPGRLLCTGFGRRDGPTWGDAYDGFLYDVERAAFIARGLYHPHSPLVRDNTIVLCESAEGNIRTLDAPLRYVDGYSRGLAFDAAGTLYAGSSRGRRSNPLALHVLNPADPGLLSGRCAVYVTDPNAPTVSRVIDLAAYADEIYDIVVVDSDSSAAARSSS